MIVADASLVTDARHNLSPYDALYVALAESLGLTLVTCDGSATRAPGLRCAVEVVAVSP